MFFVSHGNMLCSQTEKILHTLKQYIRTEMKERQHITNRYHHLLQTDPELLKSEKHTMAEKLMAISQNIQQAVNLLEQARANEAKLRREIGGIAFLLYLLFAQMTKKLNYSDTSTTHLICCNLVSFIIMFSTLRIIPWHSVIILTDVYIYKSIILMCMQITL